MYAANPTTSRFAVTRTVEDFDGQQRAVTTIAPTPLFRVEQRLKFLRAERNFYEREVARYDAEIAAAEIDAEGLYSEAEQDRKARHVAHMRRQRAMPAQDVVVYNRMIADAEAELAALTATPALLAAE